MNPQQIGTVLITFFTVAFVFSQGEEESLNPIERGHFD